MFRSLSTKSSFYDEPWAKNLGEEERVLRKLFTDASFYPTQILIWFVNPFGKSSMLENDCRYNFPSGRHRPPRPASFTSTRTKRGTPS